MIILIIYIFVYFYLMLYLFCNYLYDNRPLFRQEVTKNYKIVAYFFIIPKKLQKEGRVEPMLLRKI